MPVIQEEYYLIIIWGTLILLLQGISIVVFVLQYQKKHRSHLLQKKMLLQTLLQSQLEIKEQTLQHIAHELHDNLGQVASLIKINLNTLQLGDKEKAEQKIEDTKDLVRDLIADLKTLSTSLNGDRVVQLGIARGLKSEVERLNRIGYFEASLTEKGNTPELEANRTTILYRMVQEVLNNIVKHSGARRINISLNTVENILTLVCSDDGVGFNYSEKIASGGSGLLNLQNRAKLINARLLINSEPGNGTTISIELPL